jgi:serine/threonine protein phosphatase PrpC
MAQVTLLIQENSSCQIGNISIKIQSYLGSFTDVYYFEVAIHSHEDTSPIRQGLLRVGDVNGGLSREMMLREILSGHKMVAELLVSTTEESVIVSTQPYSPLVQENQTTVPALITDISEQTDNDYLEEECYDTKEICTEPSGKKLLLLSYLPENNETLEVWLQQSPSLESSLLVSSQVCQFFRYGYQREWCFAQISPQFVEMGTVVKFYDLTGAYPVNFALPSGLIGNFCAPELAYGCTINEYISSYTIGSLLYWAVHGNPIAHIENFELSIKPLAYLYQILKICLSQIPEERFSLAQLLSLLVECRQSMRALNIYWNVASRSTLGLSTNRMQNEDSYGIRQQNLNNLGSLILGVVADGMGGMSQGEVASKLAVHTVLSANIPENFTAQDKRSQWLRSLVSQANEVVYKNVRNGGTTLSAVLAIGKELFIAHVGDSRIYLLRGKYICQLSEDHSLVALHLITGEISYEESLSHPDRNVLTKSLGDKQFKESYIQDLSRFDNKLSSTLENGDIILLCSDGVWDLVDPSELVDIFISDRSIQASVDLTIQSVLSRGAHDNATIIAMQYLTNMN